jgi:oxygen-independent coproporphyrinogen-3 oxidase
MSKQLSPRAAYVHVPFCAHRCGYCNFTLIAGRDDLIEAYVAALQRELSWLVEPRPVETLFIGGGTPTHLPPAALARLLGAVRRWFPLAERGEFSIEANPAGLDAERVDILAEYGVTRMSLGAQSFDAEKLAVLERDHAPADIARGVELGRKRLASVSLDLIFGAPGETLEIWRRDLESALRLAPDHVSTYGLTYERGTTFWNRLGRGRLARLDEELERAMYAEALDSLGAAGFEHYEVSNFARPGHRCRHNEVYWAAEEYYAAGPGAARYIAGRRETNHRSTTTWLKRVLAGESPVAESETLSPEDRAREALVLGLRRMEGVDRRQFAAGAGFEIDALVGPELSRFVELGLLCDQSGRVRLTREGLFVSDAIWPAFLRR